ncbi:MAG: hypothetical protein ACI89U_000858, partial [Gammaproteobacteria bacterium]
MTTEIRSHRLNTLEKPTRGISEYLRLHRFFVSIVDIV